jgi:predicted nucleotidyltransferase
MNIFDAYTFDLIKELNQNEVEYLVVGGYAVNYHGYRRTTGDIDLWIKPENGINKDRILLCLMNLGVSQEMIDQLRKLDFSKPVVFVDGVEPYKIDFMTNISGVKFEEAFNEKLISELDGIPIPFIQLNHLILSKITTGRLKDKMDVDELQRINSKRFKR